MHRRQYLQAAVGLAGATALAGCLFDGSDVAPGISTEGVDPGTVAETARDRMAATSYDFEWRTEGDRLGTEFLRVLHDRKDERLLLRNREGGAYFAEFYAAGAAYRDTAPGNPESADRFEVPDRGLSDLGESLPTELWRLVRVWVSGYEYEAPEEREEGFRLDIVGGRSLVPYRLEDPQGHLLVNGDGVIAALQVAGTPVADTGEGEPTPLDSRMEARLTLETDGIEVTEPDWVPTARQSL